VSNIFSAAEALDRKKKQGDLSGLVSQFKEIAKSVSEAADKTATEEHQRKLDEAISESQKKHESEIASLRASLEADLDRERQVASALKTSVKSLEQQVSSLALRLKDSSKLRERLDKEHDLRLQAEANLRALLDNAPAAQPQPPVDLSRIENLVRSVSRGTPQRRGTWTFEVTHGEVEEDGIRHVKRVVARPT
jgi:chromosome segregation ATPase